ncbi:hypothetical protein FGW84_00980, partial [Xylella fastidiosa subsp. multiplex]|nr:hypothetical protein [Xylella fastidiosa subsp. multiplex]
RLGSRNCSGAAGGSQCARSQASKPASITGSADGAAFARKWVRGAIDDPAPDFALFDQRDGYREGVSTRAGGRHVYVQAHAGAKMQSQILAPAA